MAGKVISAIIYIRQMNTRDIVIVANSPGELSALVKPVIETLADSLTQKRIILVLTPCQYTSGWEKEYCAAIRGIDKYISAEEFKSWILLNKKPKFEFSKTGIVLYLGGDLAYPILIAKKLGYPAKAYVQDRIGWTGSYKTFFVPDEDARKKLARTQKVRDKCKIVGNLMVDSVEHLPKWAPQKNIVTFMPGSRVWQVKHTTPIYRTILHEIKKIMPHLSFQLVSSPFEKAIDIAGTTRIDFEQVMNSEIVITIPGTNTARLAALGIPMVVIFPLDNPDVIPLEGLPHLIGMLPYFGSKFKHTLAKIVNNKVKYFALPNIKAKKEIVPEIRGIIDPKVVARTVITLIKDQPKRGKMSAELHKAMGEAGAAQKIAEDLNAAL
ncbi:MAG: hypothetical protein QME05_01020 [Candidatus Margulisbacteria bacterium]|nr:hypothetical protein [Candidatus Margulisiibacteriota bacterium]